jgi:hypothetical protein
MGKRSWSKNMMSLSTGWLAGTVLTLPTTVVLNPEGQVAHLNYGVTSRAKLEARLG